MTLLSNGKDLLSLRIQDKQRHAKGTTINDLGVGPEEIEKKFFLKVVRP